VAEILPELMEEEWLKFKFVDQQEIENIIADPIVMLPVIDEKIGRRAPAALLMPLKDIDILRMRIKIF
jgi:hypothetical protein